MATEEQTSSTKDKSFLFKIHSWICWSWKYLWGIWFFLIVFLFWFLRGPLKLKESINMASLVMTTLTPKFYVALTGTSSFLSGIFLIFEWMYFRKYGTSFIEQLSVSHIAPLIGLKFEQQNIKQMIAGINHFSA
eukprot:TCONS_00036212-protein